MAKKIFALNPVEREKECDHVHKYWTGRVPCTGRWICSMCGTDFTHEQRSTLIDSDKTVEAACENCGRPANYHSQLVLCAYCEPRRSYT